MQIKTCSPQDDINNFALGDTVLVALYEVFLKGVIREKGEHAGSKFVKVRLDSGKTHYVYFKGKK